MSLKLYVRNNLKPAIGHITLIALSPADVQTMINNYIQKGGSVRMAHIMRNVLSSALRVAMKRRILHQNVAHLVDIPQYVS